ncbi:DUF4397 domain-containing protein [Mucilaginibacter sp. L196]|uniref:DUF4397 domain-containing protein n=1 Tax=Mucilaginibacter sp. L196 TaxID=1641870 RepID=UPI00131EBF9F|nr:DUF4397 domain-containing protein [Mucilaginibacter sp. L196]
MNFRIPILLIAVITGFTSCKEKDIVPPLDKNPPEVITVNTTTDTINIYQNNIRQNNTSSIYPNGATGYLPFLRGTQNFQIRRTGTTDVLFTKAVTIDSATNYTFFVAGTTADKFFTTIDPIAVAYDTVENDNTFTRSVIRIVNASYNSGPLNVTVGTADTVKSLAFGTATPFMKFNASTSQDIKIYLANSSTVQLDTTIAFQTGLIYTLYTKGSPTGAGNAAFSIGLTTNQYIPLNQ